MNPLTTPAICPHCAKAIEFSMVIGKGEAATPLSNSEHSTDHIIDLACALFWVDSRALLSSAREQPLIECRDAIVLAFVKQGLTQKQIGLILNREHTTVYASKQRAYERYDRDEPWRIKFLNFYSQAFPTVRTDRPQSSSNDSDR